MTPVKKNIPILLYHRVCADIEPVESRFVVSRSTFHRQMEFLAQHGFYTPSMSDLLVASSIDDHGKKEPIIITFDDGYLDVLENALPVMQEFGFTAVIFVVTDFSRKANWWDPPDQLGNARLFEPHHIQLMSEMGIQFGAHSFSHRSLPGLSNRELLEELQKGRAGLESVLRQPCVAVAYPYGDVDERVKEAAKRVGYQYGFAAYTGPLGLSSDLFEIRRTTVANHSNGVYLRYKLSGLARLVDWALWKVKKVVRIKN